ncbi:hypothetical protein GCM10022198_12720 [Klugiella xanthotipulae]|uniref:Uncharacterized protein n=1 Tax=Klugiella xanthotipulae TaxID=244735 RepID=A0A543I437_9MICO|nr:hypothetical protein [Klugiella xanthotipulae]TQM65362.1 hypothetical protein FB466_0160 [Klugiella xanthotipulae]
MTQQNNSDPVGDSHPLETEAAEHSSPPPRGRHAQPAANQRWRRTRTGISALGVTLLLVACALSVLVPLLNGVGKDWVRCDVVSASPGYSSVSYWRPSSSVPTVRVTTKNCRTITVTRGVTSENMQRIADSFESGTPYEFKMGWLSQQAAHGLTFFTSTAVSFRPYLPAE